MSAVPTPASSNFGFLAEHDPLLAELGQAAERAFSSDPNTSLIKLRQLGEALAQHLAALSGLEFEEQTTQSDLLYRLNRELKLEPQVRELFHTLRIEGNKATHQFRTRHKEAMDGLKLARELAIWFHRSFGKAGTGFKPGPFIAPADPSAELRQLHNDIEKLRHELQQANTELDSSQQLSELVAREKDEFEALAHAMDEESRALAERDITEVAATQIEFAPPPYDFDFLKLLHLKLFEDVYPWAGQVRSVDVFKGTTRFCNVSRIEPEAQRLFETLPEKHWLANHTKPELISEIA